MHLQLSFSFRKEKRTREKSCPCIAAAFKVSPAPRLTPLFQLRVLGCRFVWPSIQAHVILLSIVYIHRQAVNLQCNRLTATCYFITVSKLCDNL
jgi:hypothetical protein